MKYLTVDFLIRNYEREVSLALSLLFRLFNGVMGGVNMDEFAYRFNYLTPFYVYEFFDFSSALEIQNTLNVNRSSSWPVYRRDTPKSGNKKFWKFIFRIFPKYRRWIKSPGLLDMTLRGEGLDIYQDPITKNVYFRLGYISMEATSIYKRTKIYLKNLMDVNAGFNFIEKENFLYLSQRPFLNFYISSKLTHPRSIELFEFDILRSPAQWGNHSTKNGNQLILLDPPHKLPCVNFGHYVIDLLRNYSNAILCVNDVYWDMYDLFFGLNFSQSAESEKITFFDCIYELFFNARIDQAIKFLNKKIDKTKYNNINGFRELLSDAAIELDNYFDSLEDEYYCPVCKIDGHLTEYCQWQTEKEIVLAIRDPEVGHLPIDIINLICEFVPNRMSLYLSPFGCVGQNAECFCSRYNERTLKKGTLLALFYFSRFYVSQKKIYHLEKKTLNYTRVLKKNDLLYFVGYKA